MSAKGSEAPSAGSPLEDALRREQDRSRGYKNSRDHLSVRHSEVCRLLAKALPHVERRALDYPDSNVNTAALRELIASIRECVSEQPRAAPSDLPVLNGSIVDRVSAYSGSADPALPAGPKDSERAAPPRSHPLQRLTPEELAKIPPITREQIEAALEEGRRDREALDEQTRRGWAALSSAHEFMHQAMDALCAASAPQAPSASAVPATQMGAAARVLFMQAKSWPGDGGDVYSEGRCAFCARPVTADAARIRLTRTDDGEWWVIPERPVAADEQHFGHFVLPIGSDCLRQHPEFRIGLVAPLEMP